MSERTRSTIILLLLVGFAAMPRFYKLGAWPFSGDEVATLAEMRALLDPSSAPPDSQIFRMPRAIPASYVVNRAGYALFGWDEFGSRVVSALAGAGLVGAVFLLGEIAFGRRTAVVLALLVAVSPAYVLQSQTNRFYSLAALAAGVAMLAGSVAATRRSGAWIALAITSAVVSAFTHTVTAVLVPVIGVGILVSTCKDTKAAPARIIIPFAIAAVVVGAALLVYVRPLLDGWNEGVPWAYSSLRSALASVNMLGWPIPIMAALGLVLMFEDRASQRWYWTACLAGWAGVTFVLPSVMTYHPWYAFPLALAVLVFAAYAMSDIYRRLDPTRPAARAVWLCLAVGLNLPGLASHFSDGSRSDMRAAAAHVDAHWQAGDRAAVVPLRPFVHYAPGRQPAFAIPRGDQGVQTLEGLAGEGGGRLWVVMETGREGLPDAVQQWLSANAVHQRRVTRRRFDYYQYAIDIFIVRPRAGRMP